MRVKIKSNEVIITNGPACLILDIPADKLLALPQLNPHTAESPRTNYVFNAIAHLFPNASDNPDLWKTIYYALHDLTNETIQD